MMLQARDLDRRIDAFFAFDAEFKEEEHKRDEGGKFTAGGGGGEAATTAEPKAGDFVGDTPQAAAVRQKVVDDIVDQYGMRPQKLTIDETLRGTGISAHASGDGITLNPEYWSDPEKMAKALADTGGIFVDPSPAGTLIHEMGHRLMQHIIAQMPPGIEVRSARGSWYNKQLNALHTITKRYFDDHNATPSIYADDESPDEWMAEAFSSVQSGKLPWPYPYEPSPEMQAAMERGRAAAKAAWKDVFAWRDNMLASAKQELAKQERRRQRAA
jgi:hypothetical protein